MHRRNINHPAIAFRDHAGQGTLHGVKRRGEVDRNNGVPALGGHIDHGGGMLYARIVDQHIDTVAPGNRFAHQHVQCGYVAYIHVGKHDVRSARLPQTSFGFSHLRGRREAVQNNGRAGLRQTRRDGEADALCGTGYQRGFPGQKFFVHGCLKDALLRKRLRFAVQKSPALKKLTGSSATCLGTAEHGPPLGVANFSRA